MSSQNSEWGPGYDPGATRRNYEQIRARARPFSGQSVIYAVWFDNGKVKVGLSTRFEKRIQQYQGQGVTGLLDFVALECEPSRLGDAENRAHRLFALRFRQLDSETFEAASGGGHDALFYMHLLTGAREQAGAESAQVREAKRSAQALESTQRQLDDLRLRFEVKEQELRDLESKIDQMVADRVQALQVEMDREWNRRVQELGARMRAHLDAAAAAAATTSAPGPGGPG